MRRLSLPLTDAALSEGPPTAADVRKKLGVTEGSDATGGLVVRFLEDPGSGTLGVVVYQQGDECDVYLGDGWLRRTKASAVAPLQVAPPPLLASVAADARLFITLKAG